MTKPSFSPSIAPLAVLAIVVSAPVAAQSVQDFQLPPNPTPTPTGPVIQGPVDDEAPLSVPPSAVPTQRPTPTPSPREPQAPVPQARQTETPTPRPTPAIRATSRTAPVDRQIPAPERTQDRTLPAQNAFPAETAPDVADNETLETPPISATPGQISTSSEAPSGDDGQPSGFPWAWLATFAALAAGVLGFIYWRRQAASTLPATIEPPLAKEAASVSGADSGVEQQATEPARPTAAISDVTGTSWIKVETRAVQLRRSMMNATLVYRIVLFNRSGKALEGVELEADLATAHGKVPVDQQLASPALALTVRERIARLAPGERMEFSGEIQLPLKEVRIIEQGKALHCVPLLRVRVTGEGRDPVARTWVVGRKTPEGNRVGRLQPFRFDAPPQTYTNIGERSLD